MVTLFLKIEKNWKKLSRNTYVLENFGISRLVFIFKLKSFMRFCTSIYIIHALTDLLMLQNRPKSFLSPSSSDASIKLWSIALHVEPINFVHEGIAFLWKAPIIVAIFWRELNNENFSYFAVHITNRKLTTAEWKLSAIRSIRSNIHFLSYMFKIHASFDI